MQKLTQQDNVMVNFVFQLRKVLNQLRKLPKFRIPDLITWNNVIRKKTFYKIWGSQNSWQRFVFSSKLINIKIRFHKAWRKNLYGEWMTNILY